MKSLHHFQEIAQTMIHQDRQRDDMLRAMDAMWQNKWSLPAPLADLKWIHKVISTDPHDALRAGTRTLSSVEPRIKVQPLGPKPAARKHADKLERFLGWHFRQANRRRRANVLRDLVLSALLYDEIVAQVVYLPYQQRALKAFGADTLRLDAAKRFGPYAILVRNPRTVHVRYSDWMPEAVLLKRVLPLQEALDFWGTQAAPLAEAAQKKHNRGHQYVTVYDYMDIKNRVVWAVLQPDAVSLSPALPEGKQGAIQIMRQEHKLGFLPWVARVGGTTLTDQPAHQRIPLLYSVYQSGQWDTQNILETLMTSEAIAYASAPRLKIEGPTDQIDIDYGEPGRIAHVPLGHDLTQMSPPALDANLAIIAERISERIGKSTVPRILQNGSVPGGTAFATLNLATQSGVKSLTPYKELAEHSLADVLTQMLYWAEFSGDTLSAYGARKDDTGQNYQLLPKDIDIENLYIDVELTADAPTDRMQRINAAAMAVRDLGYSRTRALEQIGEHDPEVVMEESFNEALQLVELELQKQEKINLGQIKIKEKMDAAALKNQPTPRPATTAAPNQSAPTNPASGPGFNPAQGGLPPATAAPGLTPEVVKGEPKSKNNK